MWRSSIKDFTGSQLKMLLAKRKRTIKACHHLRGRHPSGGTSGRPRPSTLMSGLDHGEKALRDLSSHVYGKELENEKSDSLFLP